MLASLDLAQEIRDALGHLYDPTFTPSAAVCDMLGIDATQSVTEMQTRLRQAIEEMRPSEDVPEVSRAHRLYNVLHLRYVEKLSQETTAERLGLTTRHLRREQGRAIEYLVDRLVRQSPSTDTSQPPGPRSTSQPSAVEGGGWEEQVRSEIASLHRAAPQQSVDALSVVESAANTASVLARQAGVDLRVVPSAKSAMVQARKSALKQIVLSMLTNVLRRMAGGSISIDTLIEGEQVHVVISAVPVEDPSEARGFLLSQLLAEEGMYVRADATDDGLTLGIALPMVRKQRVLVVDDNPDLLHFYRRYTTGTPFDIVPFERADKVLSTVVDDPPDMVLLDIMLPGVDGWELLASIRDTDQGRDIPIIICSVMREQALALALGADLFVAKPVRRKEFIQALNEAASLAQARGAKSGPSNVAAY